MVAVITRRILFLSTPSARRATQNCRTAGRARQISIHALREEGDPPLLLCSTQALDFYPRPPRGGRPTQASLDALHLLFLSTPSARRATFYKDGEVSAEWISIHALREEGDDRAAGTDRTNSYFYPRPPRGGRRNATVLGAGGNQFLSTPSARRATPLWYGGRLAHGISIHALREEGDLVHDGILDPRNEFLSTPSARRATKSWYSSLMVWEHFYPRPPRGGRLIPISETCGTSYFYPRPPRGGRRIPRSSWPGTKKFLSTPSARRATISPLQCASGMRYFYPRPPRGGRPKFKYPKQPDLEISIHALREEGDSKNRDKISIFKQIIQHSARI